MPLCSAFDATASPVVVATKITGQAPFFRAKAVRKMSDITRQVHFYAPISAHCPLRGGTRIASI
jgi:hypothetical protein